MSEKVAETLEEIISPVHIVYKGVEEYTLDFSRETAVFAQERGFDPDDLKKKPTVFIPELFWYALRMHHRNIARNQADKLREKLFPNGLTTELIVRLIELYNQAALLKLIDTEDGPEKNGDTVVEF
jgi:hypothetical protein